MAFIGGPFDGIQNTPEREQQVGALGLLEDVGGPSPLAPEEEEEPEESEAQLFEGILQRGLKLADMSSVSEQNKLEIQKVMTIIQQVRAAEEKEGQDMMTGKLSPNMMRKAYSGQGA